MALSRKGGEITIRAKNLDNAITRLTTLTNQPVGKRVSFERPSERLQLIASHISIFRSFCPRLAPTHKSSLLPTTVHESYAGEPRTRTPGYLFLAICGDQKKKQRERERGENKIKHRIPSFLRLVVETNPWHGHATAPSSPSPAAWLNYIAYLKDKENSVIELIYRILARFTASLVGARPMCRPAGYTQPHLIPWFTLNTHVSRWDN